MDHKKCGVAFQKVIFGNWYSNDTLAVYICYVYYVSISKSYEQEFRNLHGFTFVNIIVERSF